MQFKFQVLIKTKIEETVNISFLIKLSFISLSLLCFILFLFISLYQFKDIIPSVYFHRVAHKVWVVITHLEKNKQQPYNIVLNLHSKYLVCKENTRK